MSLNKILFFAVCSLMSFTAAAQGKFSWEATQFDFGEILEGTQAMHEFVFENTGDQPIIISKVRASCGCTTPQWTNTPVMPGKKGTIKAVYNSKSRPGAFNKSISITSNAAEPMQTLFIKGVVKLPPGDSRLPSNEQLAQSPRISISQSHFSLGNVGLGREIPLQIPIKNDGKSQLAIVNITASCRCIQIAPSAQRIFQPGEEGFTEIVFQTRAAGKLEQDIVIQSTDLHQSKSIIHLSAQIVEQSENQSVVKEEKGIKF